MNTKNFAIAFLCLLTSSSCIGGDIDKSTEKTLFKQEASSLSKESSSVYHEMTEISTNRYCESNSDCAVLPVGERACGGPSNYVVYSTQVGEESIAQLRLLAERSKQLAKQMNQKSQLMGICQVLPAVSVHCLKNECVARNVLNGKSVGVSSASQSKRAAE